MFKRISGQRFNQNITITIRQPRPNSSLYFVSPPHSNIIYTMRDANSAIKLAYSYVNQNERPGLQIVVRDDENAWPKNYPPLR